MTVRVEWVDKDGASHPCRLADAVARFVVVDGHCPVCHDREVLVAHDVKETTIFTPCDRDRAEAYLRDRGSREWTPVPDSGEFRLRGENPDESDDYVTTADAVCDRCRSRLGRLVVHLGTLFGRREDELVMSGRFGLVF